VPPRPPMAGRFAGRPVYRPAVGYQNRVVRQVARSPSIYSGTRGGWRRETLYRPGRAVFPKGFTPSSSLPTQQRQRSAQDAYWRGRGYSTVTLGNGIRVRMPQEMAREQSRLDRMRSRLTITQPRPADPYAASRTRLGSERPVYELRGWWRKAGRLIGDALKGNTNQTPPHHH